MLAAEEKISLCPAPCPASCLEKDGLPGTLAVLKTHLPLTFKELEGGRGGDR